MENEKQPPYVQYHPSDASVSLVQRGSASLPSGPSKARKCRCTAMGLLKVGVTVFLFTTVAALALFFLQRGEFIPYAEYLKTTALPEVANITLLAADDHYITVAWDEPPRSTDFYLLDVTGGSGYENDRLRMQRTRTCSNGTFIRAGQTQVTCGPFEACSNLSVTIRTYTTGPPERTSMGTTLKEVFMSAKDPSEPRSVTMVAKSRHMTRLLWEPPTQIHGVVHGYNVKVCDMFTECDQKKDLSDCIEHKASDTSLDFNSTEDTPYCVVITASARCGDKVLTSLPVTQEVRTPLFSLPDVSNLKVHGVNSGHITFSWERPKGRFDYYSVEVAAGKVSSTDTAKHKLGLCANGTIIHRDQTEITCGPLEPCSNLSCTMRTHLTGPPERSSPGVTMMGIFVSAKEPNPPTNITMFPESPSRTRIHWDYPDKVSGVMAPFNVKICRAFGSCDRAEGFSDCTEYMTSETWTVFDSREDTAYCVLVTVKTQCGVDEVSSRPLIAEIRTPLFGLPDATELRLLSAVENSITVAWERPHARFDYYWLSLEDDEDEGHGNAENERVGSCGNGAIIHPNHTRVTCPNLEACTKVSITLRTHRNGPPERTSPGVSLRGIFIPGKDPDPPKNITMLGKSPSLTRLEWEGSPNVNGRFLAYTVKICELFESCGEEESMRSCIEFQAHETWLDFHSSVDTKYCVVVTASSQCGEKVLNGRPAVAEIRTPLFVLPDVTDLRLMAVDSHYITVAWDKPRGSFDFYWLDVTIENYDEEISLPKHQAGSCGNGTIIRAEQTQVTCGPFDPCSNISVTLRTFVKGPRERISTGNTLRGVFLSGQAPTEPKGITMVVKSPSMTRIQWESPTTIHGILDNYKVKVCKEFTICDQKENIGGCIEHSASEAWLEFQSTADTSYCTLVTASAQCGVDILTSPPATLEVRTPLFALPDVSNLKAVNVKSGQVTLSWERPKGRFDYYSVEVTERTVSSTDTTSHRLGLCTNGTIIRRDQTEITCGTLEPCSNLSFTMRTHLTGPPERSSPGVTVTGIFIPAEEPNPPSNITMFPETPSRARIHWDHPQKVSGIVASYNVKICSTFGSCDRAERLSDCMEYVTSETLAVFDSTEDNLYCVLVTAKTQCGVDEVSSRRLIAEIRTPLFGLPDATDLKLLSALENSVTVAWERPQARFDYYWLSIVGDEEEGHGNAEREGIGSCFKGTIIHANQTRVTCSNLEACTKVSITLRAHRNGPPESTSPGVSLRGIFIPGKDPDPPKNITTLGNSPSLTRLQWEGSAKVFGRFLAYTVKICELFKYCGEEASMHGCIELQAHETWLDFHSNADTKYCVLVTTTSQCGEEVLSGRPAVAEIRTPLFVLPDVTDVRLVAVDSHYVTVAWDKPRGSFDFYWLDVAIENDNENNSVPKHHAGSCGNGTIIRAEQTQVTCGPFDPCSNISVTVRTFVKGPPERTSMGSTLKDVFLSGQDPSEPKSITIAEKSPSMTRIQWESPMKIHGSLDIYKVKVCTVFTTCDRKENTRGCIEHRASEAWLEFQSTADTSYCIHVTASARCGLDVLTSAPATLEVRTSLFALPDASNLKVKVKSDHITFSWKRPKGRFDYYSVEVTEGEVSSMDSAKRRLRLCANGTIIHRDQTEITCGPLKPCSNLSCTIRTHLAGPPERSSPGVTVAGFFIPVEEPNPPRNLMMFPGSPSRTRIRWDHSEKDSGVMGRYIAKICSTFRSCIRAEGLSDCKNYYNSATWTMFDSTEDTPYCVLITAKKKCGLDRVSSRPLIAEIRTPLFGLPDATDLRLLSALENSVTVAWERPQARFDYYWFSIEGDEHEGHGNAEKERIGSCGNGTIIHPNQTRATCSNLEACTKVSITLRAHKNGPPESTAPGVSLRGIFIPGKDPDPPKNITMLGKSPSLTRLQWEGSANVCGRFLAYTVKICELFKYCGEEASMHGCIELQAHETWLDFHSSIDTKYCVSVTTSSQCGEKVLTGRPVVAEIRTPLFVLPDVADLRLMAVDSQYITVAWNKPRVSFDFYWLDVTIENDHENSSVPQLQAGSCGNGTIVRAEQTQVTCGPFDPCSNISVTVRTFIKGPPERTSMGKTLKDVFLSGQDPTEPKSITMVVKSPSMTRLQWESPTTIHGILDIYKAKVCKKFTICDRKEIIGGCIEYSASEAWLEFQSTADTSYCTLVTASARCGVDVLTSPPATLEVRTPLFALPDASNLKVVNVKSGHITFSWKRPKVRFDYYSVEVTEGKVSSTDSAIRRLGLCANGTIIHRDQTEITCGPLEPCSNLSCTMRTHLTGPPERSSPGVTITGIFIPAEEPNPPRTITMFPESPSRTRIQWDNPEKVYGIMTSYSGKICGSFKSCDRAEGLSNCMEYVTPETWRVFGSREDTAYCILLTVNTQCGIHKVSSRPVIAEIRTPLFDLPDVTKLRLLSAMKNSITIAWERPKARFDYYWVSITPDKGEKHINAGSCGNGTIIHPDQTQVNCTSLEACTDVTVSVRTHRNGPPERTSVGVVLQDIFVLGEQPDSPKNITTLGKSPSLTRLQWDPPARVFGRFLAYTVKICDTFKSCGTQESMSGCTELQTQDNGLDFHSTVDTKYCVLVAGSAQCGELVLNSLPAVAEIRTPLLHLPDVRKLSLLSAANNSITIAWERPKTRFDYYWVNVTYESGNVQRNRIGSCASGTIIHSARTQVMCTNLEACTKVSFNIRTHRSGPPEHTSHGVDLKGIFIPGEDPDPPKNITMLGISPSLTRLQWVPGPKISGTFLGYVVKICSLFQTCVRETNMSNCIELQRHQTWLNIISRVDTKYCVLVTARSKCGVQVLNGPPAVAEIRTPLFDAPDVTNLRLVTVGVDFFTAAWEKPKGSFDYYWVQVIDGDRHTSGAQVGLVGSCANGTIIHSDQTQVTCSQLKPCSKVGFKVRTHINGPPSRTSPGVTLNEILILESVLPDVTHLQLITVGLDHFVLRWQPVKACFDYYTVELIDESSGRNISVSCNKGADINANETSVICDQIETCTNVTIRVRTHARGPTRRSSTGAKLTHVLLKGKVAPEVTHLTLEFRRPDSFRVNFNAWKECFDEFYYNITLWRFPHREVKAVCRLVESDLSLLPERPHAFICSNVKACGVVNFALGTRLLGPPRRNSRGVLLRGIRISGTCKG